MQQEALAGLTPEQIQPRLNLHHQWGVIYHALAYTRLPLETFTTEVLELAPEARAKALAKVKQLEASLLTPMRPTRDPP